MAIFLKPNDETTDSEVFGTYKPLRNHLGVVSLSEAMYTLGSFDRLCNFNQVLPSDIENPLYLRSYEDLFFKGQIHAWEIETITKESLLNSDPISGNKSLRKWNYLSNGVNKLKALEEKVSKKYVNKDNVLLELARISHRQFPWQSSRPNGRLLVRYFKLFSDPKLDEVIQKSLGLKTVELYAIGMATAGHFITNITYKLPINVQLGKITLEQFNQFLNHFSRSLDEIKTDIANNQQYNERYAYTFSSLRSYPLIKMDYFGQEALICPLLTLLFWRFTSGLYYEICNADGFDNAYGPAFQAYVGDVLARGLNNTPFLPEAQYFVGKKRKDSTDWIIDSDSIVFAECKAKRMRYEAKTDLTTESLKQEVDKMAQMIIQVYKNIRDYKSGYYTHYALNSKKIYPLIITLEEWYFFGDKIINMLRESVESLMNEVELPLQWLNEMPYSICSSEELEEMVQIADQVGIEKLFSKKVTDQDKSKWQFHGYIRNDFPEEMKNIRFLFQQEWDDLAHVIEAGVNN